MRKVVAPLGATTFQPACIDFKTGIALTEKDIAPAASSYIHNTLVRSAIFGRALVILC
jgi:hypothetical protein